MLNPLLNRMGVVHHTNLLNRMPETFELLATEALRKSFNFASDPAKVESATIPFVENFLTHQLEPWMYGKANSRFDPRAVL